MGCGPGDTTVALAARLAPGRARGVDFAPEMVERAQGRFGERADVSFASTTPSTSPSPTPRSTS